MRVTIILPCTGHNPSGGFRILYEHANRMAARNHDVEIIHLSEVKLASTPWRLVRQYLRYWRYKLPRKYRPDRWFALDRRVKTRLVLTSRTARPPAADAIVASSWETVDLVWGAPSSAGRKFYFIQSFEDWSGPADRVKATWLLPMGKMVIAQWLKDIAARLDQRVAFVPNAIDLDFFRRRTDSQDRDGTTVLFQSMQRPLKGSREVAQALMMLRDKGVDLKILCFGMVDPQVFGLTPPYEFHLNPRQDVLVELYNRAAIYVTASHVEGWGLTLGEAAACGAALIATDIGGHRELARDGSNALLVGVDEAPSIARAVERLISDPSLRCQLADQACTDVQAFSWDAASRRFEEVLTFGVDAAAELDANAMIAAARISAAEGVASHARRRASREPD